MCLVQSKNKRRKNGCSWPLNFYWVASWVMTFIELIIICVIYLPFVFDTYSIGFGITIATLFAFFIIGITYLDLRCMLADPTEPLIFERLENNQHLEYECEDWNWVVMKATKHWKVWNRCVKDFDHHWKWLNNCIGYNNYRTFLVLMIIYVVYNFYFLSMSLWFWIEANENQVVKNVIPARVVVLMIMISKIVITLLTSWLLIFHIYLAWIGLSTYEFIINRRNKKK